LLQTEIDPDTPDTLFVFSTTKGNIALLDETENPDDISLAVSAEKIAQHYNNKNKPVVISNACISGVVALIYAKRLLEAGTYKNIVVTGADCISKFIHSGFQSFMALSEGACKPFSASRDGINLGEAAATVILTTTNQSNISNRIKLLGGSVTNDANHISGPSRTGEELSCAIKKAMELSQITPEDLGFISAHGTATLFNDEMEAKAFNLSGMRDVPVNSLKGYFGHTLGAAGLVESVISMIGLQKGEIIPTKGFADPVVQPEIEIASDLIQDREMNYCLKTASGFGGCNAALVFSKS
jgi:3-oxoacyl-[acyl-carrier-protein] synthase-1